MAPELLAGQGYDAGADMWALGVILFELLSGGRVPFDGRTAYELRCVAHLVWLLVRTVAAHSARRNVVMNAPTPKLAHSCARKHCLHELCYMLLDKDPSRRPTINALLRFGAIPGEIGRLCAEKVSEEGDICTCCADACLRS